VRALIGRIAVRSDCDFLVITPLGPAFPSERMILGFDAESHCSSWT
jgi:hypothetical protein